MAKPQGNPKPLDVSHVPPAARRAAEEADRLQRELTSQGNPDEAPANQDDPPADPPQPTNPDPKPRPTDGQGSFSDERERPAPTNPDTARQPPADENDKSWKDRYESEHGRLEAARRQIDDLSARIDNMARVMSTLQAAAPAPQAAPADDPQQRFVTPEMEQEWGADFMAAVEAKAKELIAPLERRITQQLEQVDGRVSNVVQKTVNDARQDMIAHLNSNVPGWVEQNEDQDFVAWLKMPDRYSRRVRKELLLEAWNSNDASTVAAFFEDFRKEASAVAPQPQPQSAPAKPGKPTLEQFAAPGAPRSAAPSSGPADKEPISRADISRFYADLAAGRFRGKEAEAEAYEKQIFEAQRDGRIR